MKYLIACLLLLAGSIGYYIYACGPMYPEDVRFSIFKPNTFKPKGFENFHYSNHLFSYNSVNGGALTDSVGYILPNENIALWKKYCNNKASDASIEEAVYSLGVAELESDTCSNEMIRFLKKTKNRKALDYLVFAKGCEELNTFFSDPWERDKSQGDFQNPSRQQLIDEALKQAKNGKGDLKLRYAFIAVRLAFYNADSDLVKKLYNQYFQGRNQKNIIDYWALYFYSQYLPEGPAANFYYAQVFANAPDKRMNLVYQYKKNIPLDSTLQMATTSQQKVAVFLLDAVRNPGRALVNVQKIYALDPQSAALDFLLLREINKIEDWLYTPEYYLFPPSVSDNEDYSGISYDKVFKNVERDRAYAKQVLQFVDSVGINDKILWTTAKAYLHFMLKAYDQALVITTALQKNNKLQGDVFFQVQMIEALALTARQQKGNAVIPEKVKPLLLEAFGKKNYPFIFAIAKELEHKNNTTDAALLMTRLNEGDWRTENVFWKNERGINNKYIDFHWEYFGYADAQYTANEIKQLLLAIQENGNRTDAFSKWQYAQVKSHTSRLYDLLGTKYIRENNLAEALKAFKNVSDSAWNADQNPYKIYLAANPFYTNLFNEHTPVYADTIHYTKTTITATLIDYHKKALDVKRADRDYYNFLIANCYLNMTQYGNSWMMRRNYWSSSESEGGFIDDEEYFNCNLAKKYYQEARKLTKSKKFAALCLRMAGRCEKYRLRHGSESLYNIDDQAIFEQNKYYRELKAKYPEYYDDLISNCESFESYFAAGGKK